jgi:hypothetical protein
LHLETQQAAEKYGEIHQHPEDTVESLPVSLYVLYKGLVENGVEKTGVE